MEETPQAKAEFIAEAIADDEERRWRADDEERRWRSRSVQMLENHPSSSFVGWYFDPNTNSSIQIVRHPSEKDRVLAVAAAGWAAQMQYVERKGGKYIEAIVSYPGKPLEGRWSGGDRTVRFSNGGYWRFMGKSNAFDP